MKKKREVNPTDLNERRRAHIKWLQQVLTQQMIYNNVETNKR